MSGDKITFGKSGAEMFELSTSCFPLTEQKSTRFDWRWWAMGLEISGVSEGKAEERQGELDPHGARHGCEAFGAAESCNHGSPWLQLFCLGQDEILQQRC